jgi:hypothetical protein
MQLLNRVCLAVPFAALALLAAPSAAQVTIDFESFALGGGVFLDVPETIAFPNAGGSAVSVTIQGFDDLRVYDMNLFGGTGSQALIDMDWTSFSNPLGTDILFDADVSAFSLLAGDFGSDDDSPIAIVAFDNNGMVVGSDSVSWPVSAVPPLAKLSISASGIRRVHFSSGGPFANSVFIDDITFTPGAGGGPTSYCTGKLNSAGCVPLVQWAGTPSASTGSGFSVGAMHVINQTFGACFYGKSGPASLPFQGGTLCVAAPLTFLGGQSTGGASTGHDCSGAQKVDFNVWIASGADPALVAGQMVHAQFMSRDVLDATGHGLSDAIEFTIGP